MSDQKIPAISGEEIEEMEAALAVVQAEIDRDMLGGWHITMPHMRNSTLALFNLLGLPRQQNANVKTDTITALIAAAKEAERLREGLDALRSNMRKKCYCHATGGGTIKCEWHAEWIPCLTNLLSEALAAGGR